MWQNSTGMLNPPVNSWLCLELVPLLHPVKFELVIHLRISFLVSYTHVMMHGTCAQAIMPSLSAEALAKVMLGCARIEYQPGELWLEALLDQAGLKMSAFGPSALSDLAASLAFLECRPGEEWIER